MRERIAGAFVLLAVVVILLIVGVRAWTLQQLVADQEAGQEREVASLIAAVVAERVAAGEPVGEALLAELVGPESQVAYVSSSGRRTVVAGASFDPGAEAMVSEAPAGDGRVVVTTESRQLLELSGRQVTSMLMLALLVAVLAGVAGWLLASRLAGPFTRLASAAEALGRGRFDLRLPPTRIPEAQAIGQALRASADQLESRLARERDFAEFASHELRTPLTALQLELDDLTLRDDVPEDAKAAASRCLERVGDVNAAAGHLVALTRRGPLVAGSQLPLGVLATQVVQAWSDRLVPQRRPVTARADGDLDVTFTPGPVEHVLELVLDDLVGGEGAVRLRFVGSEDHVRISIPPGLAPVREHAGVAAARETAAAQGGLVTGDLDEAGLQVLMPRR